MCDVTDIFIRLKVPPKYNLTNKTNISVLHPMTTLSHSNAVAMQSSAIQCYFDLLI